MDKTKSHGIEQIPCMSSVVKQCHLQLSEIYDVCELHIDSSFWWLVIQILT